VQTSALPRRLRGRRDPRPRLGGGAVCAVRGLRHWELAAALRHACVQSRRVSALPRLWRWQISDGVRLPGARHVLRLLHVLSGGVYGDRLRQDYQSPMCPMHCTARVPNRELPPGVWFRERGPVRALPKHRPRFLPRRVWPAPKPVGGGARGALRAVPGAALPRRMHGNGVGAVCAVCGLRRKPVARALRYASVERRPVPPLPGLR
jgi:hypothetical protein